MIRVLHIVLNIVTAMVGYTIHGSVFWAIMDFIFMPLAWMKWLILHEVTFAILRQTFGWFFD